MKPRANLLLPFDWVGALLIAVFLSSAAQTASAWNAATHRLVASIAWSALDHEHRQQAWALLQAHADFPHWRSPRGRISGSVEDADYRRLVFSEASVWADSIRDAADFDDSSTAPAPAGFPDRQRRRDWHYVNQPLGESAGRVLRGRLHEAIPLLQDWLSDPTSPYRSYALVWLLHVVADLHQPLHVSTRRLGGDRDDAGGNEVRVQIDDSLLAKADRGRSLNLHRYWDNLVAPAGMSGKDLARLRKRLIGENARVSDALDVGAWRAQSFALAAGAYRGLTADGRKIVIGAAVHRANVRIAERQVVRAAYRLAGVIAAALDTAARSAETAAGTQRVAGEKILRRQAATTGPLE